VRIGAVLSPVDDWQWIRDAAVEADELGFDSVGLWDHYHSARAEYGYVAGWSAHAALAEATQRVRIVPAVLNTLHYELGVLAKESSMLSLISGGRFEMALGAGDWPESFAAWGQPFPGRDDRVARLAEVVRLLRQLWAGEGVTLKGQFHQLSGALSAPVPDEAPKVIVGVGASMTLASSAIAYADELNVYADESVVARARQLAADSARDVPISLFLDWGWDKWPADPITELGHWRALGVDRVWVSLGADDMPSRLRQLEAAIG
jgi:alkanesulfonate monooxygenase SsuD/methylene tetrahydromethanopterin reductase-like flavin-dependent oxidoreductase (luciferase family)